MANAFGGQIQNRNFLSPIGFKFILTKYPKVSFFSNSTRIPGISLGVAVQPSYLKNIDIPGEKLDYEDFYLRFLVDENMENYMTIHNWMTGLGFPESTTQYEKLITDENGSEDPKRSFSDGTLQILNSNSNINRKVIFKDLFPTSLSSLEFEASGEDINYFTAEVAFRYTIYNIVDKNGKPL